MACPASTLHFTDVPCDDWRFIYMESWKKLCRQRSYLSLHVASFVFKSSNRVPNQMFHQFCGIDISCHRLSFLPPAEEQVYDANSYGHSDNHSIIYDAQHLSRRLDSSLSIQCSFRRLLPSIFHSINFSCHPSDCNYSIRGHPLLCRYDYYGDNSRLHKL